VICRLCLRDILLAQSDIKGCAFCDIILPAAK
jgi:hypothetical protein